MFPSPRAKEAAFWLVRKDREYFKQLSLGLGSDSLLYAVPRPRAESAVYLGDGREWRIRKSRLAFKTPSLSWRPLVHSLEVSIGREQSAVDVLLMHVGKMSLVCKTPKVSDSFISSLRPPVLASPLPQLPGQQGGSGRQRPWQVHGEASSVLSYAVSLRQVLSRSASILPP